jgi:hypothetical protein
MGRKGMGKDERKEKDCGWGGGLYLKWPRGRVHSEISDGRAQVPGSIHFSPPSDITNIIISN